MECRALQVMFKKSMVDHSQTRTRIFEAGTIEKGDVVGYYYKSLVYETMTWRQHITNTYGGGSRSDQREISYLGKKWITETVNDWKRKAYPVWI